MKILVTGGAGFIGSNFVRWQRERHPEDQIVVLDALTYAGNINNLAGLKVEKVFADVADRTAVAHAFEEHRPDAVVHFAAESHVDRSILGPEVFVRTNVLGTAVMLEQARKAGVTRFVHVSTDEVYGDIGDGPAVDESTPLRPRSPYAASKVAADHLVMSWFHTYGFPVLITRCCNNYGPRQLPEKLIPLAILRAVGGGKVPIYGNGRQVREWIHVEDHCAAIDAVLRKGAVGEVYNIGTGESCDNLWIVREVLSLVGRGDIEHVADRPGHDRRYAVDSTKIRTLGWWPEHQLDRGLASTVDWYKANLHRWEQA